jgi:hypothetical protein
MTMIANALTTTTFRLGRAHAEQFAQLAADCVQRELPNAIQHVIHSDADVQRPRVLHPAFYGCLDWHSAVHGHWLLVRLLRAVPDLAHADAIRAALDANLTATHLVAEAAYFTAPLRGSYERPYGWAWLLQLAGELHAWADPDAARWSAHLAPLTQVIIDRYLGFLPKQTYAVRTGVHANTAFGMAFALDYARLVGHTALEALLVERATAYYAADRDAPAAWEPGGEDFLSPTLVEADLMRRVLAPADFAAWLHGFLPRGLPPSLQTPATAATASSPTSTASTSAAPGACAPSPPRSPPATISTASSPTPPPSTNPLASPTSPPATTPASTGSRASRPTWRASRGGRPRARSSNINAAPAPARGSPRGSRLAARGSPRGSRLANATRRGRPRAGWARTPRP